MNPRGPGEIIVLPSALYSFIVGIMISLHYKSVEELQHHLVSFWWYIAQQPPRGGVVENETPKCRPFLSVFLDVGFNDLRKNITLKLGEMGKFD